MARKRNIPAMNSLLFIYMKTSNAVMSSKLGFLSQLGNGSQANSKTVRARQ